MEITAKEILEKEEAWINSPGAEPMYTKSQVLAFGKEIAKEAWDAGKERGIHLGKCEVHRIHPQGRPGVPQRRHEFMKELFPQSES
jgi:hypothetical protein